MNAITDTPDGFPALVSPVNGEPLRPEADHLLTDGERLWPHFDGCYYLRVGREALVEEAVSLIRSRRCEEALILLLCDRRDAGIPQPAPRDVREMLRMNVSFHRSTELLAYGGLGWYFEHRWIIPTYLSGLSLLHWQLPRKLSILEIGSGVGHLTAHWERSGGSASVCSDVVFSHLWLSRRYLRPGGVSVCFDANGPFPFPRGAVDAVVAHDCLHYLSDIPGAVSEMRRVSTSGRLLVGHLHNAEALNFSPGHPLTRAVYERLLEPSAAYDDAELTGAWLEQRPPEPLPDAPGEPVAAFGFVTGVPPTAPLGPLAGPGFAGFGEILPNPLLGSGTPVWPSEKFIEEYVRPFPYLDALRRPGDAELERWRQGTADAGALRDRLAAGVAVRTPGNWY